MAPRLVIAYDTRTGEKRLVPENWFDIPEMSANLTRTDPGIAQAVPEGVNQPVRPDAPDFPLPGSPAAAQKAVEIPDGDPTDEWTVKQLDAYAGREGIDLASAGNKAEKLTAIAAGPTNSVNGDTPNTPPAGDK